MSHHSPLYVIILSVLLLAVGLPAQAEPHATANPMPTIVRVDLVHTGLGSAVTDIQPVPGQPTWLLIVLKDGEVRLSINGVLQVNPYLTVNPSTSSESGLWGLAFHPEFGQSTGRDYVYVHYSLPDLTASVVRRFSVSNPSDQTVQVGETNIIRIPRRQISFIWQTNHWGGQIAFGPDDYLYIATGDGGSGGDPLNSGQDLGVLQGKILRIDVNSDAFPADADNNYAIPVSNPFVGQAGSDEIWAYGLRNPWRFSFDTATGDLYIADVGQNAYEEVNRQLASSGGGENYGWRCREGPAPYTGCGGTFTEPIFSYHHSSGHRSITGGYVYQGSSIPEWQGDYIFGDFVSGLVWRAQEIGGGQWVLAPIHSFGGFSVATFGQTTAGEIYIGLNNGSVHRIVGIAATHAVYVPLINQQP